MLPATRTVEAAGDYGYRSPARTASPLTELEAWMDADTRRTASRASKGAAAASSPSSIMASPRSGAAPPASPTSRHAFMRLTETALGAAVRRYPTEVALSPATVRSSSATAAVLPTGLAPGRTLSRARTSSAAADFGYDLGPATSGTITVPEIVEMRRIVDRRNTARDRNIGIGSPAAATDKVGLSADPFADTPAYVSPYRTASAGSGPTPSSAISRSTNAYESPVAYAAPRGSGLRTGDELFRVPAALAGTEISEVVRDYTRTGGVLNGASSLGALDAPVDTTADALLERLKEEQWQRERKGHGRKVGEIGSRIESQIGGTASMAAGGGAPAGPPRPLTLTEKLAKIKALREGAVSAVDTASKGATRVSSFDTDADHPPAPSSD